MGQLVHKFLNACQHCNLVVWRNAFPVYDKTIVDVPPNPRGGGAGQGDK